MTPPKSKFLPLGKRWAFFAGAKCPTSAISTAACYSRKFWRFYRVGPGLSRAAMLQLIALNAAKSAAPVS